MLEIGTEVVHLHTGEEVGREGRDGKSRGKSRGIVVGNWSNW